MYRCHVFRTLALLVLSANFARAGQVAIDTPIANDNATVTADEVRTMIAQAVGFLKSVNQKGIIAVTDREGHILAIFRMSVGESVDPRINEQATVKARTAAFFQSQGNAFTTRTAQFIVQSNFPPKIRNVDAGPLFGVPFSNFPGTDTQLQVPPFIVFVAGVNAGPNVAVNPGGPVVLPPGNSNFRPPLQPLVITPLTDDLGGIPFFKGGAPAGGVGVEIDGFGVLANGVPDQGVKRSDAGLTGGKSKALLEEQSALAAIQGFEPPGFLRGDKILINGFRFPFTKARKPKSSPVPVETLSAEGNFEPYFDSDGFERSASGAPLPGNPYAATFNPQAVIMTDPRATPAQEFPSQGFVPRFPPRASPLGTITEAEVRQLIQQAADQAAITRAAIRNPKGAAAAVWICVVDTAGNILGSFRTKDATIFSFDVHIQKARTAAFFSTNEVGFSTRAVGFVSQTFYPPGVDKAPTGPLSGLLRLGSADVGNLGTNPAKAIGADGLREISQLLTDRSTDSIAAALASSPGDTLPQRLPKIVQLLARRLPHIRDGRLDPVQVGITVDLTLRGLYAGGGGEGGDPSPFAPPTTIKNGITIFPGGVPIYKGGVLVGALGVSGDGVDQDDVIAFNGHRGFEPPTGVRCDSASDAKIRTALQAAAAKLKAQFPTLTNGNAANPAVLDVLSDRLENGALLQGLRLPYVKFPRSSNR